VQALLAIADIGGYTSFMKLHRLSIAHAQANTDRLLRATIDAAPRLRLVALEGDAAFFYVPEPEDEQVASTIAGLAASMHRSFHERRREMESLSACVCEACDQLDRLRVKFVAHLGEVVVQKARRATKIAGLDVIVVHRMLKNTVPIPEYLLMTEPVLGRCDPDVRAQAEPIEQELEGVGTETLHYLDLERTAVEPPPRAPRPLGRRLGYTAALTAKSLPALVGIGRR
jgi:Protein of unknown function (DUF2652)